MRLIGIHMKRAGDIRPMGLSKTRDQLTWGQLVLQIMAWLCIFGVPLAWYVGAS